MTSAARRYLRLAWSAARALEWCEVVHWLWLAWVDHVEPQQTTWQAGGPVEA